MLSTYNITSQTVDVNENIVFSNNQYQTGCSTIHVPGSTTIEIRCPGTYLVIFNGVASATAESTDPITLQLYNGTTAIPGAVASQVSTAAADYVNLAFGTILQIRPSCLSISNIAYLTIQNLGVEAELTAANLNIVKIAC